MTLVTKYQVSVINSCWEKCDEKCAYMFNVYKDQLSRQTGSRNLTGPKTLPTIWYTYNIWCLWPNIRFLPSTVTEKNATKNILDGRKDRGKTVYPPPLSGSGGIKTHDFKKLLQENKFAFGYQNLHSDSRFLAFKMCFSILFWTICCY